MIEDENNINRYAYTRIDGIGEGMPLKDGTQVVIPELWF